MMSKKKQQAYNHIEDIVIEMWQEGLLVRSCNPDTKSGEYMYTTLDNAENAYKNNPSLGRYLTYKEFQTELNNNQ